MRSEEILRDLRHIEWLVAVLSMRHDVADDDLRDLQWLHARHKLLTALLAFRTAQKDKKVVSLAAWRWGHAATFDHAARVA